VKPAYSRNLCGCHYSEWWSDELSEQNEPQADYRVPERIRTTIWEISHLAIIQMGLTFDTFHKKLYADATELAAQRQWTRIKEYFKKYKIPFIEILDKRRRAVLHVNFSLIELEDHYFREVEPDDN